MTKHFLLLLSFLCLLLGYHHTACAQASEGAILKSRKPKQENKKPKSFPALSTLDLLPEENNTWPSSYQCDFTEGFDNLNLVILGRGTTSLIKNSSKGVKTSNPRGLENKFVGVSPRFIIRGDFEITVDYQIHQWKRSQEGTLAGISLYLLTEEDQPASAELSHYSKAESDNLYTTFFKSYHKEIEKKGASKFQGISEAGKLRLKRIGDQLTYAVCDTLDGDTFYELRKTTFSTSDIRLLRFGLKKDDPASAISATFKQIVINASELPLLPSESGTSQAFYQPGYKPPQVVSTSLIFYTSIGLFVLVAVGGVYFWMRNRI